MLFHVFLNINIFALREVLDQTSAQNDPKRLPKRSQNASQTPPKTRSKKQCKNDAKMTLKWCQKASKKPLKNEKKALKSDLERKNLFFDLAELILKVQESILDIFDLKIIIVYTSGDSFSIFFDNV